MFKIIFTYITLKILVEQNINLDSILGYSLTILMSLAILRTAYFFIMNNSIEKEREFYSILATIIAMITICFQIIFPEQTLLANLISTIEATSVYLVIGNLIIATLLTIIYVFYILKNILVDISHS